MKLYTFNINTFGNNEQGISNDVVPMVGNAVTWAVCGRKAGFLCPCDQPRYHVIAKILQIYTSYDFVTNKCLDKMMKNFRSRRWGSSLTICARLTVRSSPHQQERKFSGARVCRVTFKHLPQPLRSHTQSFGTLGQLLKIPPLSGQI